MSATNDVLERGSQALAPINVRAGFNDTDGFALIQRGANLLAQSTLVPKEYQNNVPNCVIALEMAQRIGASPLMVMQNLYVVHGKPAWSSQFLIACVNQCGRFSSLQYEWTGTPGQDDYGCRAWAIDKTTNTRVQGPAISIGIAKKEGWVERNGSKWKTLPELMLTYRAATFFARTNAPELTMGLQTAEEVNDVITLEPGEDGTFGAVRSAQRKSEQSQPTSAVNGTAHVGAEPSAQASAPAEPAATVAATPAEPPAADAAKPNTTGRIVDVQELATGTIVKLSTGFRCAIPPTSAELIAAAKKFNGTAHDVELNCKAPRDAKYAPVLQEITAVREAGSDDQ